MARPRLTFVSLYRVGWLPLMLRCLTALFGGSEQNAGGVRRREPPDASRKSAAVFDPALPGLSNAASASTPALVPGARAFADDGVRERTATSVICQKCVRYISLGKSRIVVMAAPFGHAGNHRQHAARRCRADCPEHTRLDLIIREQLPAHRPALTATPATPRHYPKRQPSLASTRARLGSQSHS